MQRAGLAGLGTLAVLWLLALAALLGLWSGRSVEPPGAGGPSLERRLGEVAGARGLREVAEGQGLGEGSRAQGLGEGLGEASRAQDLGDVDKAQALGEASRAQGLGGVAGAQEPGEGLGEASEAQGPPSRPLRPPSNPAAQKTFRALLTLPGQSLEPTEGLDESGQEPPPPSPAPAALPRRERPGEPVRAGIFWSRALEAQVPRGFSPEEASSWLRAARQARVVSLERGGCGRSSNRLALLSDGSRACVRYGINPEQIQGEALSYHLAGLLGMQERLPPLALSRVEAHQWAPVQEELRSAHWSEGAVVSLARWVDNLTDVVVPAPWRAGEPGTGRRLQPLAAGALQGLDRAQLVELVQWSDLILFDYLTANFDRLVSNLFSLQWDPQVMQRATSNLHRGPDGGLVFLDNEAGLAHGYRLLAMWDPYNEPLLRSVCIFRETTARKVRDLHHLRNAASELLRLYRTREPLAHSLGFLSAQQARLLQERIDFVHRHILRCKARAASL